MKKCFTYILVLFSFLLVIALVLNLALKKLGFEYKPTETQIRNVFQLNEDISIEKSFGCKYIQRMPTKPYLIIQLKTQYLIAKTDYNDTLNLKEYDLVKKDDTLIRDNILKLAENYDVELFLDDIDNADSVYYKRTTPRYDLPAVFRTTNEAEIYVFIDSESHRALYILDQHLC